ncbi:cupin domain-containing protein [Granulicella sp. S156]|jgi:quercetin dioxygenase-like cupin family protein|uniref:cupin domain-containing protein n=1 Tax=Granulicella sp. S156 TaxID=1747224 RepID=UPI00131B894B|nr:cupin domain-containing protein [Granulicella sp. S156]
MSLVLQNIPTTEGVRKISPEEGETFDIAGAHITWKVKAEENAYAFAVCEQTLQPGEGVPLHSHIAPEVFYILAGSAEFFRVLEGKENWIHCEAGSTMILPPNALHAFYNKSSEPCRVLGISTPSHQAFFDAVASADLHQPFSTLAPPEAMERVAKIAAEHAMYFAPYDVNATAPK